MKDHQPSRTALRVAVRRAAHQLLDSPKVFDDPLALPIIGAEEAARLVEAGDDREVPSSRFLRAFMAARSRYAEDQLASAVGRGVAQYVILGAGLDTFPYRNPYDGLRVFEVDHPATQAWKRDQLGAAGISIPGSVAFAPVDFGKQNFAAELMRVGFKPEAAFFSWLGVTLYLTREAVFKTLRQIVALHPENGVAFDFAVPRSLLDARKRAAFDALARRARAAGEPFQGFFSPQELSAELASMGYRHVEDLDAEAINSRYFKDRTDGLRVGGGLAHLACAWS